MLGKRSVISIPLLLLAVLPTVSLAGSYEEGEAAFNKKDYATAMQHWEPLAESGDARAQLGVARLYYSGHGVLWDYKQAAVWCAKAAAQGEPEAQYILGSMYRDGTGVERDSRQAMDWLLKAATQGVPGAQYSLGLLYFTGAAGPPNPNEAYYWLGLAATATGSQHSQMRSTAAFARDDAGSKLSKEQISELNRRIVEAKTAQAR